MDRRLVRGLGVAVCAAAVFAGCSGGGGGGSALPVTQTALPKATSAPTVAAKGGTASFTFLLPFQRASSIGRNAKYVSPSTQSVTVSLLSVNGSPPGTPLSATINIGAGQPGCTPTGVQVSCDLSVVIPLGSDSFFVTAYSGLSGSGSIVATATVPSYTLYANAANHVTLTLSGAIASLYLFAPALLCGEGCPAIYAPSVGTPTQALIIPIPLDAAGNQIVLPGNYSSPIAFTVTPHFGAPVGGLLFTVNGGPPAATVQLNGPADQLFLVGQPVIGQGLYDVNASGGGSANLSSIRFVGLPTPTPAPNPIAFTYFAAVSLPTPPPVPGPLTNQTLNMFVGGSTQYLFVTDTLNPTGLTYTTTGCTPGATSFIASAAPSSGTPFASGTAIVIAPTTNAAYHGTCTLTVTDTGSVPATNSVTLNVFNITGSVQ